MKHTKGAAPGPNRRSVCHLADIACMNVNNRRYYVTWAPGVLCDSMGGAVALHPAVSLGLTRLTVVNVNRPLKVTSRTYYLTTQQPQNPDTQVGSPGLGLEE